MNTKIRHHLTEKLTNPGDHIVMTSDNPRRLQIAILQAAKVAGMPVTTKRRGENIIITRLPRIKSLDDAAITI